MEKRVVLFLVLSLAIILGYDYVLRQLGITPAPPERPAGSESPATPPAGPPANEAPTPAAAGPTQAASASVQPVFSSTEERLEEVSTALYRAVFTTRAAEIRT